MFFLSVSRGSDVEHDLAACDGHGRLSFVPTPQEIAEVAGPHLARAERGIASFGQGCEGEPLLQARVIEVAIRLIRARTLHWI